MVVNSRTVKIVDVRVEPASELEAGVEAVFSETLEAGAPKVRGGGGGGPLDSPLFAVFLAAEVQAGRDHLDVPLPQGVVDHVLVFFHLQNEENESSAHQ